MAKYKYTGNKTHSLPSTNEEGRRNQANPGDIVELTDAQYAAFKDKFVPHVEEPVKPAKAPDPEPVAEAAKSEPKGDGKK